jgi:Ca2+/H+ antiporter, TMEM165/GDT1 family
VLTAFTAGLLLITFSELGDKTFFIAVVLSMRHSRRLVFVGATAALAAMTILSVLVGKVVSFLPKHYIHYLGISLFIAFGLKLLYDAYKMRQNAGCDEAKEAQEAVDQASAKTGGNLTSIGVIMQTFAMTFMAEWGDRTQFATINLAAINNPLGVTLGAILGHSICAAIAVVGGRLIANCISERIMTALGGILFLIFAAVAGFEGI